MLQLLEALLTNEALLGMLATVVTVLWGLPRVSQWRRDIQRSQWQRLYELAELAVTRTWLTYTRAVKEGHADGKLSDAEAQEAREMAIGALKELARDELPGLLREYGDAALSAVIHQVHAWLQGQGAVGSSTETIRELVHGQKPEQN